MDCLVGTEALFSPAAPPTFRLATGCTVLNDKEMSLEATALGKVQRLEVLGGQATTALDQVQRLQELLAQPPAKARKVCAKKSVKPLAFASGGGGEPWACPPPPPTSVRLSGHKRGRGE